MKTYLLLSLIACIVLIIAASALIGMGVKEAPLWFKISIWAVGINSLFAIGVIIRKMIKGEDYLG